MARTKEQIRKQFGIPDWRDAAAYPKALANDGWRWEFLRRREDYRRDWLQYMPQTVKAYRMATLADPWKVAAEFGSVSLHNFICTPDHPEYRAHMPESVERYGLVHLLNPAFSLLPVIFVATSGQDFMEPGALVKSPNSKKWLVPADCCAIAFNYRLPLKPQLERAELQLTLIQKHLQIRNTTRKRHDKYVDYLRALDAEADGATYQDIANVLWPSKRGTTPRARGEEILKAAHKAQDSLT